METWLSSNVARGCSVDSMIDAMVQAGFATEAARAAVHKASGRNPAQAAAPAPAATEAALVKAAPQTYQYDESPVARGNVIRAHDRDVHVLMRCERPQVIVFAGVLSPDECNEMIERSRHRLKRSTTVNPATGKEDVIRNRTSEGIWYQRGEDPFIEQMDRASRV